MELPEDVYQAIVRLCAEGDRLVEEGKLEEARAQYGQALDLIPGDHRTWKASTWVYVALGDVHWKRGDLERAFKCFINAVQCPDGLGNPYVHLRLGQLYFEQGRMAKAEDELVRAYMGGGMDVFCDEDAKYFDLIEAKVES